MALRLPDQWLWDFWCARAHDVHHVFYLQAPRSLGHPDERHWHVSIGHAVSKDLETWTVVDDALGPGAAGEWDDYTTWTGSVIRHDDRWAMLYTGTSRHDEGLIQRIGLAWSDDLMVWTKDPRNPVLELDPQRYEELDRTIWHDQAWRDPWVTQDPNDGRFHAYLTARARVGPGPARGVIAHAVSDDLSAWTVGDPVTEPGVFGHMEIPQLIAADGRWYLLFAVPGEAQPSPDIGVAAMLAGTHFMSAAGPQGPFTWSSHGVSLADAAGTWYGAKLIEVRPGEWVALAWRNVAAEGGFAGTLSDPMPITWDNGPRIHAPSGP